MNSIDYKSPLEKAEDLFEYLGKNNDEKFLLSKTCEELTELQEVLLKMNNKIDPHKPSRDHLIEEIGDVEIRLTMLKTRFDIFPSEIINRKIYKADKFDGYLKEGKYKNNI